MRRAVDLAAVLCQTGFQIDRADEQEQSQDDVQLKDKPAAGEPSEGPPADISASVPRSRKPAASNEQAEVSIDEYMSRLLARSRGDSAPLTAPASNVSRAPVAAAPVAAPRSSPAPVVPAAQDEPSKPHESVEMAPRAVAPETQVDVKAMRQLANFSASNALHKHESKQLLGSNGARSSW